MKKVIRKIFNIFNIETDIKLEERKRIANDMISNSAWFNKSGNERVSNCLFLYGVILQNNERINIEKLRATIDDVKDINIQYQENEPICRKILWGIKYSC